MRIEIGQGNVQHLCFRSMGRIFSFTRVIYLAHEIISATRLDCGEGWLAAGIHEYTKDYASARQFLGGNLELE